MRDPYSSVSELHNNVRLLEQEELIGQRQDHRLRLQFFDLPLHRFWVMISNEFS